MSRIILCTLVTLLALFGGCECSNPTGPSNFKLSVVVLDELTQSPVSLPVRVSNSEVGMLWGNTQSLAGGNYEIATAFSDSVYTFWYQNINLSTDTVFTVQLQRKDPLELIILTPGNATINIGGQITFTTRGLATSGIEIPGILYSWKVEPASLGSASSIGFVSGGTPGTAIVSATAGQASGIAKVVISS